MKKRIISWYFTMTMVMCMLLSIIAGGAAFAAADANENVSGGNPLLNFVGTYMSEEGMLTVEAGEGHAAVIEIYCEQSEQETAKYSITGDFDPETLRVNYAGGIKEILSSDESEAPVSVVEYTDGAGHIQFYDDGTIAWQNETEEFQRTFMWFDITDVIEDITSQEFFSQNAENIWVSTVDGHEYVLALKGEAPDWTQAVEGNEDGYVVFEGLTPATEYEVYIRAKADPEDVTSKVLLTSLYGLSLEGEPYVGETITVTPDPEDIEGLTYQWYYEEIDEEGEGYAVTHRGDAIDGADSSSYTPVEADLGKTLCVVISKDGTELESTTTGPVETRDILPAELCAWDAESIRVYAADGQEYVIVPVGGTPDWANAEDGGEEGYVSFEGLTPATEYEVYTRVKDADGDAVSTVMLTNLYGLSLAGEPYVGETITVTPDPENAEGLAYQWYYEEIDEAEDGFSASHRGDMIDGADSASYTVTEADLGKTLCVVISKNDVELDFATVGPIEKQAIVSVDYKLVSMTGTTEDASHTWLAGSGDDVVITVKLDEGADDSFAHFVGVEIDGEALVRGTDYTVREGSTIVTIKAAALQKLSAGEHTVTILFDNGKADASLTVKADAKPDKADAGKSSDAKSASDKSGSAKAPSGKTPNTGDETDILFWVIAAIACMTGTAAAAMVLTRSKKNN